MRPRWYFIIDGPLDLATTYYGCFFCLGSHPPFYLDWVTREDSLLRQCPRLAARSRLGPSACWYWTECLGWHLVIRHRRNLHITPRSAWQWSVRGQYLHYLCLRYAAACQTERKALESPGSLFRRPCPPHARRISSRARTCSMPWCESGLVSWIWVRSWRGW